jgi:hypothetical protein
MFRTAEGLTLGYLSGTYNSTAYPSAGGAPTDLRSHYSRGDVGKLCDMGKVRSDIIRRRYRYKKGLGLAAVGACEPFWHSSDSLGWTGGESQVDSDVHPARCLKRNRSSTRLATDHELDCSCMPRT